jgi:hypothetical protein
VHQLRSVSGTGKCIDVFLQPNQKGWLVSFVSWYLLFISEEEGARFCDVTFKIFRNGPVNPKQPRLDGKAGAPTECESKESNLPYQTSIISVFFLASSTGCVVIVIDISVTDAYYFSERKHPILNLPLVKCHPLLVTPGRCFPRPSNGSLDVG